MGGGPRMGAAQGEVDRRTDPDVVVAIADGMVLGVGREPEVRLVLEADGRNLDRFAILDADGGTVTPGLIDPHTHLLFAGSREGELELRRRGAAYLDILAAGGGILSTVAATRAASAEELHGHGRRWLDEMLGHGVTTVEAKSGYGLDLPTELRLLDVAHRLDDEGPIEVSPTWLGAHAVPPELRGRPDATESYVRRILTEQLPGIAAQGRAVAADVFCEEGVFSADQSRRILEAAAASTPPAHQPRSSTTFPFFITVRTRSAAGQYGIWRDVETRQITRSACLPGSSEPTSSARPIARAALIVTAARTSSGVIRRFRQAAVIARGRLAVGDVPGLKSVPIATGTPRSMNVRAGA